MRTSLSLSLVPIDPNGQRLFGIEAGGGSDSLGLSKTNGDACYVSAGGTLQGGTLNETTPARLLVGVINLAATDYLYVDGALVASGAAGANPVEAFVIGAQNEVGLGAVGIRSIPFAAIYPGDITTNPLWPAVQKWLMRYYGISP